MCIGHNEFSGWHHAGICSVTVADRSVICPILCPSGSRWSLLLSWYLLITSASSFLLVLGRCKKFLSYGFSISMFSWPSKVCLLPDMELRWTTLWGFYALVIQGRSVLLATAFFNCHHVPIWVFRDFLRSADGSSVGILGTSSVFRD